MKKRGFKFVGTTIIYAYLQAVGVVNDHLTSCKFKQNNKGIDIMKEKEEYINGYLVVRKNIKNINIRINKS